MLHYLNICVNVTDIKVKRMFRDFVMVRKLDIIFNTLLDTYIQQFRLGKILKCFQLNIQPHYFSVT